MSVVVLKQEFQHLNLDCLDLDKFVPAGEAEPAGRPSEPLDLSDVVDAVSLADPGFGVIAAGPQQPERRQKVHPYVKITEQPSSKARKFRYKCEGRTAGSISGANTTPERKTYPTIKVCNYVGPVRIIASCVTKEEPYRAHPHSIVSSQEWCKMGVCTITTRITKEAAHFYFKNLGIQCVKRNDIAEALKIRERLRVDPYKTGFNHMKEPQSIDLNAVRLCIQVFLPDVEGEFNRALEPVVTNVLYSKNPHPELVIMKASHCSGPINGGTQIILLCGKVTQEDTEVVFYLEVNNAMVWEETVNMVEVHNQCAIIFTTPAFKDPQHGEDVTVLFQLRRPSDNMRSNSVSFEYICEYPDLPHRRKKVAKILQDYGSGGISYQPDRKIKLEPRDKTPCLSPLIEQWVLGDNVQSDSVMANTSHNSLSLWAKQQADPAMPSANHSPLNLWAEESYGQPPSVSMENQLVSPPLPLGQPQQIPAISMNMQPISSNVQLMSTTVQHPQHQGYPPSLLQQMLPPFTQIHQQLLDTAAMDLSNLLDRGEQLQLDSGELSADDPMSH